MAQKSEEDGAASEFPPLLCGNCSAKLSFSLANQSAELSPSLGSGIQSCFPEGKLKTVREIEYNPQEPYRESLTLLGATEAQKCHHRQESLKREKRKVRSWETWDFVWRLGSE